MATTASAFEDREMSIGRVLERAFATTGHNPLTVLGIAVLVGGVPSAALNYLVLSARAGQQSMQGIWGIIIFAWLASVVIGAIVQGAMIRATVAEGEGAPASFVDCLATGGRAFLPLLAVGLLYGLAMVFGSMLLIVPGVIAMLTWSVAAPALVVERTGILGSFSRSQELTSGVRTKIFGLFVVLLVIYIFIFGLLDLLGLKSMTQPTAPSVMSTVGNLVNSSLVVLLWNTIQPSLYIELRQAKGGGDLESLADIFS